MKFRATWKDPDAIAVGLEVALGNKHPTFSYRELMELGTKELDKADEKGIHIPGEYITLEIDTDTGSVTYIPEE